MAGFISRLRSGRGFSQSMVAGAFLLPGSIMLLLFVVTPFLLAVVYSFTDLRLVSPLPMQFVGLRNYLRTASDPIFQRALLNIFYFVIVVVPLQSIIALFMAMLVNQKLKGVRVFRTIYFAPVVTVMAVAATSWRLLYQPDGLFNGLLGLEVDWLRSPLTAMPAIMLLSIWQGAGFQMIILLAGLQDISEELYEAAAIDGASRWQQFVNVTLPQLRNTLIFVVTITTILAFRLFDQVYVLTNGGPLDSTQTIMLQVVRVGFSQQRIGQASAMAVVFFLIVLAVSLLQRRLVQEEGEVS